MIEIKSTSHQNLVARFLCGHLYRNIFKVDLLYGIISIRHLYVIFSQSSKNNWGMYLGAFIDAGALMKCTFLNPNFAIGHNQGQKGKRKSNTSTNWPQYDFLIRGYRSKPLQVLFAVASCLATANSRLKSLCCYFYPCPFLDPLAEKDTFLTNVTNVSVSAITIKVLLHQQNYKKWK